MTLTDQRIAIAVFCGWNPEPEAELSSRGWGANGEKPKWHYPHQLPYYPMDLNAIHEAEKCLASPLERTALWLQYNATLFQVATEVNLSRAVQIPRHIFGAITATAPQRAEALLKTINKWKD